MLSSSPSKITDLAIPGASLRPADLAAPAKLRNTSDRVGAENPVTSCDLQILVYEATEAVSS
jgi:hypothetical protein